MDDKSIKPGALIVLGIFVVGAGVANKVVVIGRLVVVVVDVVHVVVVAGKVVVVDIRVVDCVDVVVAVVVKIVGASVDVTDCWLDCLVGDVII